jgi:hypothetical protein
MADIRGYEVISDSPTETDSRHARSGSGGSSDNGSKSDEDYDDTSFQSIE